MLIQFSPPLVVPIAMLTQFSPVQNTQVQHSPNSHLLQLSGVQYSANFHLIRNHPNNSHPILICVVNTHAILTSWKLAGANAHLMLIYNFHQIGENWLRIGWELSESWNYFLLGFGHIFHNFGRNVEFRPPFSVLVENRVREPGGAYLLTQIGSAHLPRGLSLHQLLLRDVLQRQTIVHSIAIYVTTNCCIYMTVQWN